MELSPRTAVGGRLAVAFLCLALADHAYATRDRDELIVGLRPGVSEAQADALLAGESASPVERIDSIRARVVRVPEQARSRIAERLGRRSEVEFVEANRRVAPALATDDPQAPSQWYLSKIGAPGAWDVTVGSSQIAIAVLDSGVDAGHPDLAGKLLPGWNFHDGNGDTADVYGHGTKVAGAAAAATDNGIGIAGVGFDSSILPVRVSDPAGYAYYSTIAQGLTWAADQGARVMNVSFAGVAGSAAITSAARYVRDRGGFVVAAAGNCGCVETTPENPYVLSVSATDAGDALGGFSSRGGHVDLACPGTGIMTTLRGGGYGTAAGTSYSSPITAAVVALMFAVRPTLSGDEITEILQSTAVDLGAIGHDSSFGAGRIDARAAVLAAAAAAPRPPDVTAPAAQITSPSAGSAISGTVTVAATAMDDVGVVAAELWVDGSLASTDSGGPWAFAWNSGLTSAGAHSLEVRARDAAGNVGRSPAVSVTVTSPAKPTRGKGKR